MVALMVEVEIKSMKVQPRKAGGFMITIPKTATDILQIKDSEVMKVFVDIDRKRVIYELKDD